MQASLADMAYQLGVAGVLQFHTTLGHLARQEWQAAHQSALASAWARETPERAARVAGRFLPPTP